MKSFCKYIPILLVALSAACVSEFMPETSEDQELVVVEGLITDQPDQYIIKVSKSLPLGGSQSSRPLRNCSIYITDDHGGAYTTYESQPGVYTTNSDYFRGVVGRKYQLHMTVRDNNFKELRYESLPVEMKPVPAIDSLYYEKRDFVTMAPGLDLARGVQVYLDTHSPDNSCRFFRWEFTETWEFRLPYPVPNSKCWVTNNSDFINIKNTSAIANARVNRYPLTYISGSSDRLKEKYSVLVKQYSLTEDEFSYWDKLRNISEQVGGLYDITPSSISSNIVCIDDPAQRVLGYFSVSAETKKRLFIKDRFTGIVNLYNECIADTIRTPGPIPGLNEFVWVLIEQHWPPEEYRVITYRKGCYDCTVRGSGIEPLFWNENR